VRAYCHVCGAERACRVVQRDETYPVKGEPITVRARVAVCDECGADLFYAELDEHNLKLAFQEYRRIKRLLDTEDMLRIRSKYSLSQRGLAALLGWSPATVARYEMGAIPSVPHSEQIRRFGQDIDYASELFQSGREQLGRLERRRVEARIDQLRGRDVPEDLLERYLLAKHSAQGDELRGHSQFDLDKAANMIVFFARRIKMVAKSKLLKLLWYSDFLAYRRRFKSISGMAYCHNYYGPIPIEHEILLWYLQSNAVVDLRPYDGGQGEYVEALVLPDGGLFSEDELQVLEDVCRRFGQVRATKMTEVSHQEEGYSLTELKAPIPYDYAMNLKAIQ